MSAAMQAAFSPTAILVPPKLRRRVMKLQSVFLATGVALVSMLGACSSSPGNANQVGPGRPLSTRGPKRLAHRARKRDRHHGLRAIAGRPSLHRDEIGRASCRERVEIS